MPRYGLPLLVNLVRVVRKQVLSFLLWFQIRNVEGEGVVRTGRELEEGLVSRVDLALLVQRVVVFDALDLVLEQVVLHSFHLLCVHVVGQSGVPVVKFHAVLGVLLLVVSNRLNALILEFHSDERDPLYLFNVGFTVFIVHLFRIVGRRV